MTRFQSNLRACPRIRSWSPTEAEWEYACRGGTTTKNWCGDDPEMLAKVGNIADASAKEKFKGWDGAIQANDGCAFSAPVGSFRSNPFGLYHLHGNAWEWCEDWFKGDEYGSRVGVAPNPRGPADALKLRVLRGGGWGDLRQFRRSGGASAKDRRRASQAGNAPAARSMSRGQRRILFGTCRSDYHCGEPRKPATLSLRLKFGPEPQPLLVGDEGADAANPGEVAVPPGQDADDDEQHPFVYLGDPIFRWNMTSHHAEGFYTTAFNVLKPWLELEHANRYTRAMNLLQKAQWTTSEPPTTPDNLLVITSGVIGEGARAQILKLMKPTIRCLLLDRLVSGTEGQVTVLDQLVALSRALNVDPCSNQLRDVFGDAAAVAKHPLPGALPQ